MRQGIPKDVPFWEVAPENYIGRGGYYASLLRSVREAAPIVTHGLTLSLGGVDPLDVRYLEDVRAFAADMGTPWHSDHLCFTAYEGRVLHELLPIPFTREGLHRITERVQRVQDVIRRPFAVENVSAYVRLPSEMTEAEFLCSLLERTGCGLVLDLNNAVVNATNFSEDARAFVNALPLSQVVCVHVAGGEWITWENERLLVDTHGAETSPEVHALLGDVVARVGSVPVVLERDTNVPPLAALLEERRRLEAVVTAALAR